MRDRTNSSSNNMDENINKMRALSNYLLNLSKEYEEQLYLTSNQRRNLYQELIELEEKITLTQHNSRKNSSLFSPNSKIIDDSEIYSKVEQVKKSINGLTEKQSFYKDRINYLKESSRYLELLLDDKLRNQEENKDNLKHKGEIGLNILEVQEQDRQRIARDLHDSTVQNLTGLLHKFELCNKLIDIDQIRAKLEISSMTNTLKSIINEMRDIIYNLKPMSLDDLGLVATIERLSKQIMLSHNIKVSVTYNQENKDILPVINLTLFRVIQEACNNAIKHAKATSIEIDLSYKEDKITVTVRDNGMGFDIKKLQDRILDYTSGFGLTIMRERICLLSGTMEIQSEEEKGTNITFTVPFTICKGDKDEQAN
ncbi:sensor histidine kinase [Mobilitalea sibirica]|uniref:Oxygen sensor histidine kinase NreB n=1 Tax=Mobilitalea sibirica TaxID=1462919 RepID=A0A8J7KY09_9FIRM|nr:sensor histidine kinase [Mobilitalea sibirica]MBH1942492.1 sensor histidine kinase [Mobilitalea sibirica]